MPQNSEIFEHPALDYVIGSPEWTVRMSNLPMLRPFADEVVAFLNDLSRRLMPYGRKFSDVGTFGFWCRKGALLKEKEKYDDLSQRLGRGIVFHSTPSNVPVNFAFSMAAGMLAGNANIVRLPGKSCEQVDIICGEMAELLHGPHSALASGIALVKFPPVQEICDYFSRICICRVVWGGDNTIRELRKSPLPPRAGEITFADRFSIAVIDADSYLAEERKDLVTQNFYNDTYFSDQNACTAPRVVIWFGREKEKARTEFWENIRRKAMAEYALTPVQSVGKFTALCRAAIREEIEEVPEPDRFVTRIKVKKLTPGLMGCKYNSGFFFEYDAEDWSELRALCSLRCQTLSYFGIKREQWRDFVQAVRPAGVDRIVPMGKTMDFTLDWDGHDLIREMSRKISLV